MTLLITSCSKTKCASAVSVSAAELCHGSPADVASAWFGKLERASDRLPASERYAGRGHRQALAAAARQGAHHLIMSAGLGLVRASDEIPPYHLTIKANEEDSIVPRLDPPAGARDWWALVEQISPFFRRLEREWNGKGVILVALPVDYVQLLMSSLERLPASAWDALRVISGASADALPEALRPYRLPYDARFDGPDSDDRGTGADFLGRAAGHFLSLSANLGPQTIDAHRELVDGALRSMRPTERRQGRSLSDAEIAAVIRSDLAGARSGSARLLRKFRDELGIACEQKRFQRLYGAVTAEWALA